MKGKDKEKLNNPLKGSQILSSISSMAFHIVQWDNGQWENRTKGQWDKMTIGKWENNTKGQRDNGTMRKIISKPKLLKISLKCCI